MCKSTVNLALLVLQTKRTRIQKIQQGTKNKSKWKEVRQLQTKQWFIMLNRLTEDKSKHISILLKNIRQKQR